VFQQMVPVTHERHHGKKVRGTAGFEYASQFHIAYVTMHEFARAAAIYPIVFLEDKPSGAFRSVVLMGLENGENLFIGSKGAWSASYIPAMIRRYPFALSKGEQEGRFVVCVDEASSLLSDTEGSPLFEKDGKPSQVIENVKRYLSELQQMDHMTLEFSQFLRDHNLLSALDMRVNTSDQVKNITGCFVISEERMNELPDEVFRTLREKRYLPAMYAHLISLPQIERLVQMKKERAQAAGHARA